jgi:ATP-binding cassette subfamily C protein
MICEDVINLSGGEKQKISLVRTFLKESDLIILDEPTNALDMKTKKILIDYIELIKKNKIIIIITHDRDMCGFGDELIRLNNCNS